MFSQTIRAASRLSAKHFRTVSAVQVLPRHSQQLTLPTKQFFSRYCQQLGLLTKQSLNIPKSVHLIVWNRSFCISHWMCEKTYDPCGDMGNKKGGQRKLGDKKKYGYDPCEESQKDDPCAEEKKADPCAEDKKYDPCAEDKRYDPCAEEKKYDPCAEEKKYDPCADTGIRKVEQRNFGDKKMYGYDPCVEENKINQCAEEKKIDPCADGGATATTTTTTRAKGREVTKCSYEGLMKYYNEELMNDIKQAKDGPYPAQVLGLAGLIPFVAPPICLLVSGVFISNIALCQLAYGAAILSFLGGVRWGFSVSEKTYDWMNLGYSVVPPLIAWVALLMPIPLSLLTMIGGLAGSACCDVCMPGYPAWFRGLRMILTIAACGSLLLTLLLRYILRAENKCPGRN